MKEGEVTRFALNWTSFPPQAEGITTWSAIDAAMVAVGELKNPLLRAIGTKSQNPKLVSQIWASRVQKWWGGDIFLSFLVGKNLNRLTTMGVCSCTIRTLYTGRSQIFWSYITRALEGRSHWLALPRKRPLYRLLVSDWYVIGMTNEAYLSFRCGPCGYA